MLDTPDMGNIYFISCGKQVPFNLNHQPDHEVEFHYNGDRYKGHLHSEKIALDKLREVIKHWLGYGCEDDEDYEKLGDPFYPLKSDGSPDYEQAMADAMNGVYGITDYARNHPAFTRDEIEFRSFNPDALAKRIIAWRDAGEAE